MTVRTLTILTALVLVTAPQAACGGCSSEEEAAAEGSAESAGEAPPTPEGE